MYYVNVYLCSCVLFFYFKQKTAYEMRISDWSSDVCSSDLRATAYRHRWATFVQVYDPDRIDTPAEQVGNPNVREGQIFDKWNRRVGTFVRSEERRVGKECVKYV